jgi:hypothetical protein
MEGFAEENGDLLCKGCRAVFWTARVLLNEGISDEAEIVPTMVFAAEFGEPWALRDKEYAERFAEGFPRKHGHLEIIRLVDGVPVLREKTAGVNVIRYAGTELPERVRLKIFSKYAKPEGVAELYERTLREENTPWDKSSSGSFDWDFEDGYLTLEIGLGKELDPEWARFLSENPQRRRPSFSPPGLVGAVYKLLLGSSDPRNLKGFAYALGEHGRSQSMTAEKAIPACTACWVLGGYEKDYQPAEVRPRVAGVLNRHLLRPCNQTELPEDYWVPDDTVWRDAGKVEVRFYRVWHFLLNPPL